MPRTGWLAETVKLLDNVAAQTSANQRVLARQIGVSVGMLNALMQRAVAKGLIKIKEAPARRYAYYLTPKGFAEKSRLVAAYLDHSLTFFRTARQQYGEEFARCAASGRQRIVLCGAGELAEIAMLASYGLDVSVVAVLDHATNHPKVAGLPVIRDIAALTPDDVLVITDGRAPQETYDRLAGLVGTERLMAPPLLRITMRPHDATRGAQP